MSWYNKERCTALKFCSSSTGWVAEWSKAPVLKTGVPKGTVSSNLTPSAIQNHDIFWYRDFVFEGSEIRTGKGSGKL